MQDNEPRDTLEGRLLLWLTDFLTTFLLAVGMVFPCLEAYGVSGRKGFDSGAVLAFCVFVSFAAAVIFTWRRAYWAVAGILAAGGVVFWRLWAHMAEDWDRLRDPRLSDLFNESWAAMFLLYALVMLTLGWIAVRVRAWWLAAAMVMLPVLPAIQAGILPAWGAMLAGFAGWGSMLLTDLFDSRDKESLARAKLLSLGGISALVLLLVMCLPRENYARPQWATSARRELILGMNRQLSRFFDQETLDNNFLTRLGLDLTVDDGETVTGPGYGWGGSGYAEMAGTGMSPREDLSAVGPRRYVERLLLRVDTDQPAPAGRMYLKGASFGNYTGTSWESGGVPEEFFVERYALLTAPDGPEYTMRVRDPGFWGTCYYPYRYAGEEPLDGDGRLTMEVRPDEEFPDLADSNVPTEDYAVPYRPGGPESGFLPLEGAAAAAEAAYRAEDGFWMYRYLPGTLGEDLAPLLEEIRELAVPEDERLPEQYREAVAAAARTAEWLSSAADYDPNTPAMGDGEDDFVGWFLEQKRGFCVHFATAGAMLLRAQGIPSRYVNGFVAEINSRGQGVVLDSDAHAWVEIYLSGYGWYPVEMTPGYTGGPSGAGLEGAAGDPEDAASDAEDPEEDTPEEDEPPEKDTPEEDPSSEKDTSPGEDNAPPEDEAEAGGIATVWKVLFALAVFWGVLCAAYLIALLVRSRARQDENTNRSVLSAYGRYKRLRHWGCGEDDELESLAKKAKFSQHTLTEKERESAWKCLNEDVKQSRIGQPVRRRWILALLEPVF